MAKYRMVRTDFWGNPVMLEEMTPEDKYFYLYLLTNSHTTQIGIYKITKKQIAFDMGYSIESVQSLMERFIDHHKFIRYNAETREIAIKHWGKYNLHKAGKPVMDCIMTEMKEVEDHSLIQYVTFGIQKQEIRTLYDSFVEQEEMVIEKEIIDKDHTYRQPDIEEIGDVISSNQMIDEHKGTKEQPPTITLSMENENAIHGTQKTKDVKEIIELWDSNGFGFTNVNAKEQLLSWLDDSSFLQPKEMIVRAMNIACANNKRRLSYVVGILKNWENESIVTIEELVAYQENQKEVNQRKSKQSLPGGRDIPSGFVLDLTAGEEE